MASLQKLTATPEWKRSVCYQKQIERLKQRGGDAREFAKDPEQTLVRFRQEIRRSLNRRDSACARTLSHLEDDLRDALRYA